MSAARFRVVSRVRRAALLVAATAAVAVLLWRVVDLQVLNRDFLRGQGTARHERVVVMPAQRGNIVDRRGEPLAVSALIDSIWANPKALAAGNAPLGELAQRLRVSASELEQRLGHPEREFAYLQRHVEPSRADAVMALGVTGIYRMKEARRYYPAGEIAAHLLGYTNIDDAGQEGLELAYDEWLRGVPGKRRVIKNRRGDVIEDLGVIQDPQPGRDLRLTIDRGLQYLAYRELKAAVLEHKAKGGSLVLLDVERGELLAVANLPAFNPNNREDRGSETVRNRAFTDLFEPGSTMKPFTVLTALLSGRFKPNTVVDTAPGTYRVGRSTVRDVRNYGRIDVARVITKSSNVGAAKLALAMPAEALAQTYQRVGFGTPTAAGFPGEGSGQLRPWQDWRRVEQATLSFGYGLSVTAVQLARAYSVLATGGVLRPLTLVARETVPEGERVFPEAPVREVRAMLETVVGPEGTAQKAQVPRYRVGGKTGTVRKAIPGGYSRKDYLGLFAGMAPITQPRLVLVVVIHEPRGKSYYGGQVAAPVFARVMEAALRLLNVPPDKVSPLQMASPPTFEART